jgi:peroxiredoxin
MGLPPLTIGAVSLLLPLIELATGLGLLLPPVVRWARMAAVFLFAGFLALTAYQVARGRRPECVCFGRLFRGRIGWGTVAGNAGLAVLALLLFLPDLRPGDSGRIRPSADAHFEALVVVAALQAAGLVYLVAALRTLKRRLAVIQGTLGAARRAEPAAGLEEGTEAPAFALTNVLGGRTSLTQLLESGLPILLLWIRPDCPLCAALLADAAQWEHLHHARFLLTVISEGTVEQNLAKVSEVGLQIVLVQEHWEVAAAYHVPVVPAAGVVRPDGTVAGTLATTPEAIRQLAARLGDA